MKILSSSLLLAADPTAALDAATKQTVDAKIDTSVLTGNGQILTRAGGVPAPITRGALADDAAFVDRYGPIAAAFWGA